jgi:hypothetical protein
MLPITITPLGQRTTYSEASGRKGSGDWRNKALRIAYHPKFVFHLFSDQGPQNAKMPKSSMFHLYG